MEMMSREQAFAEGAVAVSRLMISALAASGVTATEMIALIGDMPPGREWRTPGARQWLPRAARENAPVVTGLPDDLPMMAGERVGIFLRTSYIRYSDDVAFYGSDADPEHLLIKGTTMPRTVMQAFTSGTPIHEIVAHPCIRSDQPVTITKLRPVSGGVVLDTDRRSNRAVVHPVMGEILIAETPTC